MKNTLKIASGIGMIASAALAVSDFSSHQYMWGLLMVGCFFLNLNTFRSTTRDE